MIEWEARVAVELARRAPRPGPALAALLALQSDIDAIVRDASDVRAAKTPGARASRERLDGAVARTRWLRDACVALRRSARAPTLRVLVAAAAPGAAPGAPYGRALGPLRDLQPTFDAALGALRELLWRVDVCGALRVEGFPRACDVTAELNGGCTSLVDLEARVGGGSGLSCAGVVGADGALSADFHAHCEAEGETTGAGAVNAAPLPLGACLRALTQRVADGRALNARAVAANALPQPPFPAAGDAAAGDAVAAALRAHLDALREHAASAEALGLALPESELLHAKMAQLHWALQAYASLSLARSDIVVLRSLASATLGEAIPSMAALLDGLRGDVQRHLAVANEWEGTLSALLTHVVAFDTEGVTDFFLKEDRTHARCAPQPTLSALRAVLGGAADDARLAVSGFIYR